MSSSSRTIVLQSSDGVTFEIEEAVAQLSVTIKQILEGDHTKTIIPLPNVKALPLSKIINYCKKKVTNKDNEEALKAFDVEFVNSMDEVTMTYVSNAARVLEIQSLHYLVWRSLHYRLKAKPVDELFQIFSVGEELKPITEALIHAVLFRSSD